MKKIKWISLFTAILLMGSFHPAQAGLTGEEIQEFAKTHPGLSQNIESVRQHEDGYGLAGSTVSPEVKEKRLGLFGLRLYLVTDIEGLEEGIGKWKIEKGYKNFPSTDAEKDVKEKYSVPVGIIDGYLKKYDSFYDVIHSGALDQVPFINTANEFINGLKKAQETLSKLQSK